MQNLHTLYRTLWEIVPHPTWRDSYCTITAHIITMNCNGVEVLRLLHGRYVELTVIPIFQSSELRLSGIDPKEPRSINWYHMIHKVFHNLLSKIHKSEYLSFFLINFWYNLMSPVIVHNCQLNNERIYAQQ